MVRIMTLIRPVWVALVLAFSLLVGCASTPDTISSGAAHQIDPIRQSRSSSTGWLVARVDGNPRDIQYYVNGVLLEPEEPIEWWKDAYMRVQLRPGLYDLEARYLVRAFAGRGIEYHIVTRNPVEVRPGVETEVEARLEKDWRGVPAAETVYFIPVTEERRARKAAATTTQSPQPVAETAREDTAPKPAAFSSIKVPMTVDPQATPEILEEVRRADALAAGAADRIVIHGNQTGTGSGSVVIQNAGDTTPTNTAADNIVIRGEAPSTNTPLTNTSSTPVPTLAPPGVVAGTVALGATLTDAAPEDTSPEPTPPFVLEGAEEFGITVQLESVPAGATVLVDEQSVGTTPVAVRLDPRADHIIEFTHDGCGDYVRLLSSTSWREGRDTTVKVQLYCD
jgi:hypothetical protein